MSSLSFSSPVYSFHFLLLNSSINLVLEVTIHKKAERADHLSTLIAEIQVQSYHIFHSSQLNYVFQLFSQLHD